MVGKEIIITRGFNINLAGEAVQRTVILPRGKFFSLKLLDFHGIIPKLLIKEGDFVMKGDPVFASKNDLRIQFTAPVSGKIFSINRGEKRKVISIDIEADVEDVSKKFNIKTETPVEIKKLL